MKRLPYFSGRTTFIACQSDPRFSYCLYVPEHVTHLCVYVHGTERDAAFYRDELRDFADANHVLILSPLFPAGLIDPNDVDNYKHLLYHDIRFDQVLLKMVGEVQSRYGLANSPFLLGGFSGGAQFALRFFYLHPDWLLGVSAAAPGRVTLLDDSLDWWPGIRDVERLFGQTIKIKGLHRIPIQLLSGSEDNADNTTTVNSTYWAEGANTAGITRLERITTLHHHYAQLGMKSRLDIVQGCGHEWLPLKHFTIEFFETILKDDQ